MKCSKAQDLFSGYLENKLEPPMCVAFEQHLDECSECQASYERFNATVMVLDEIPAVEPDPGFHAAVMARVDRARRGAPAPVRWWHVDWGRVFTVRVPAKAVAMGFSVLLLAVLVMQFAPIDSITAGLPWSRQPAVQDREGPLPSNPWNEFDSCKPFHVDVEATPGGRQSVYTLLLSTDCPEDVPFEVDLMPDDGAVGEAGETIFLGTVAADKAVEVPIIVTLSEDSGGPVVARISGRGPLTYSQYVFLPSKFDPAAASKNLTMDFPKGSVYDALSTIAESYGVVIVSTAGIDKIVDRVGVSGTPAEALYDCVSEANLRYDAVKTSVYTVDMGR